MVVGGMSRREEAVMILAWVTRWRMEAGKHRLRRIACVGIVG